MPIILDRFGNAIPQPPAAGGGQSPTSTTTQQLDAVNTAIPGFSALTGQATNRISDLLAGRLPNDVSAAITRQRATQAVESGMPGSNAIAGTLGGNATLRDVGMTSLQAGQQGYDDLLKMLGTYSGTVTPNVSQNIGQQQLTQSGNQFQSDLAARIQQANMANALQQQQLAQHAYEFQQNYNSANPPPKKTWSSYGTPQERFARSELF